MGLLHIILYPIWHQSRKRNSKSIFTDWVCYSPCFCGVNLFPLLIPVPLQWWLISTADSSTFFGWSCPVGPFTVGNKKWSIKLLVGHFSFDPTVGCCDRGRIRLWGWPNVAVGTAPEYGRARERHRELFDQPVMGFPCWTDGSKHCSALEERSRWVLASSVRYLSCYSGANRPTWHFQVDLLVSTSHRLMVEAMII